VFNTEHLSSMFERVIVASGTSNRQTKALAASVRDAVKGRGMQVLSTEGEDNGEWIIVDCGAAVAHIMQPAVREYYHLEEIWGGKAVRMKSAEPTRSGLVKAGEAPAAKRGTQQGTPQKAPAKKPAAKPTSAKTAAPRAAPPTKKATAKRPVAKKAPVRQAVAKKAVAKKAPARKTAARKAPRG
jgi:ribosome-associated protein